jgi:hypothetical protein
MNKLLLLLSLTAVECAWDSPSMLIAQTQSEAKASPSAPASTAVEDENKPQLLKTSPSGTFRVVQNGGEFWIVTAADENQRTKMHSADLVIPEEFRFSPDKSGCMTSCITRRVCRARIFTEEAIVKLRDLTTSDLFSPSSHHWRMAPGLQR